MSKWSLSLEIRVGLTLQIQSMWFTINRLKNVITSIDSKKASDKITTVTDKSSE